jgi:hypothetical protein
MGAFCVMKAASMAAENKSLIIKINFNNFSLIMFFDDIQK